MREQYVNIRRTLAAVEMDPGSFRPRFAAGGSDSSFCYRSPQLDFPWPSLRGGRTIEALQQCFSSAHRHHVMLHEYFEDILAKLAHAQQKKPTLLQPGSDYLQALLPDNWAQANPTLVRRDRREDRTAILMETVEELQRFSRLPIGREQRVIQWKRKINALSTKLGRDAPYDLSFGDERSHRLRDSHQA